MLSFLREVGRGGPSRSLGRLGPGAAELAPPRYCDTRGPSKFLSLPPIPILLSLITSPPPISKNLYGLKRWGEESVCLVLLEIFYILRTTFFRGGVLYELPTGWRRSGDLIETLVGNFFRNILKTTHPREKNVES